MNLRVNVNGGDIGWVKDINAVACGVKLIPDISTPPSTLRISDFVLGIFDSGSGNAEKNFTNYKIISNCQNK